LFSEHFAELGHEFLGAGEFNAGQSRVVDEAVVQEGECLVLDGVGLEFVERPSVRATADGIVSALAAWRR
jgi:hypothetical protein